MLIARPLSKLHNFLLSKKNDQMNKQKEEISSTAHDGFVNYVARIQIRFVSFHIIHHIDE
jgi:hypothetical protein